MNCCFWLLSGLVLESNAVFFLVTKMGWETYATDRIDLASAIAAMMYNGHIVSIYYSGKMIKDDKYVVAHGGETMI